MTAALAALGLASGARTNAHLAWTFGGVTTFLLCWQAWLFLLARRKQIEIAWDFAAVRSHYVQALVQLSVYAYWGWYWRNVWTEAPQILAQIAFLYTFDALLTWSRKQTWRLGFGPWPIILSTNLFLWFRNDWFVFQFLMVALGAAGKHFIRWQRGGKLTHIFNPSAFGLTVVSLVLLLSGSTGLTWGKEIAGSQDTVPHLLVEIFLSGLVVQGLFSVTLLTFSAVALFSLLMVAYTNMTGVYLMVATNFPVAIFLGMHLLMTDPATTPRSSLGKTLFGGLYGAGAFLSFALLTAFHLPEFYDKLLVVPVLNLLAPLLDRLAALGAGANFARWEARIGPRRMNFAYMGGWVALFVVMLATGFVEAPHPGSRIDFWIKAAQEKRPHAAERLRLFLDIFDQWDLHPDGRVLAQDANGTQSRNQVFGNLYAQVAAVYSEGKFVPPDPAKAARYFAKACAYGNTEGCVNYAIECFRANPSDGQMNLDPVLSALEQSGAAATNGRVCYLLAFAHYKGIGRPLDKVKARQFFEKGALLGEPATWQALALMQLRGEGGPPDHAAAALWFEKAAGANNGQSCMYLAEMYDKGDGVSRDGQKAQALLQKACNLGVAQACQILETMNRAPLAKGK